MNMQQVNDAMNKGINDSIKYIKNLPNDEKYSWTAIITGIILIIVAIIIW